MKYFQWIKKSTDNKLVDRLISFAGFLGLALVSFGYPSGYPIFLMSIIYILVDYSDERDKLK